MTFVTFMDRTDEHCLMSETFSRLRTQRLVKMTPGAPWMNVIVNRASGELNLILEHCNNTISNCEVFCYCMVIAKCFVIARCIVVTLLALKCGPPWKVVLCV